MIFPETGSPFSSLRICHLKVPDRFLFTDYEAFLEAPINIVVISTPIQFHAEQSIRALESGNHVPSEITAAWTIERCEQIVNEAAVTNRAARESRRR